MSFAEVKDLLPTLTAEERAALIECLHALDEGISVEELRAMNAAIDEELNDPSPTLTLEEVRESVRQTCRSNAAST